MPYVLDTDHVTLIQKHGPNTAALVRRVRGVPPDDIATTIISFQEQTQGWLAALHRGKTATEILKHYARLDAVRVDFQRMNVLAFSADAQRVFESLRPQCRRVGTLDLRIASIAVATDSILLTRNAADFRQVPGLRFEDWTKP